MYQKTTLDNGLRIISCPMPHTRSVSVLIFVGTGSRYEEDGEAGVSHFIEHLCFKGTSTRPSAQAVSETIEGVGGILNGSTDQEVTTLWAKVARPHMPIALDLLVDMLRHSRFHPDDVEKERQVILEELNTVKDSPHQWVDVLIDRLLWQGHPLGRDIAGTRESVSGLTRDGILGYLSSQHTPGNTVICAAGDISHDDIVDPLRAMLEDWEPGTPKEWAPAVDGQHAPQLKLEYRRTEQVHLSLALRGLSLFHPDRYALGILNIILGEGMSSRLFVELRENKGLTYSIYSYVTHFLDSGALNVYAGVDPKRTAEAVAAIVNEIHRMKERVTAAELAKAKEIIKGRLLLRMEDTRSVAGWVGAQELLTGRVRTVDEVVEQAEAVSHEDVQRVACQLLVTEKLNLAVVGPCRSERGLQKLLKL
ncbi:MAG: pitrilysin family protein [Dehalococcoidia bacterium]